MGSYNFTWQHPADEVWVTGTFDKWSKSTKLDRVGTGYEKTVNFPTNDKILYKFVADGEWKWDHTAQTESDHEGNVNNVLYPSDLKPAVAGAFDPTIASVAPGASTLAMAGAQPLETAAGSAEAPGAFPETPAANDEQSFSVNPIPATAGIGNPIHLAPGEKVPDPSTITGNTVSSTVKTDQASYEKSDASVPDVPPTDAQLQNESAALFGLGPQTTNMIPESSMGRGEQTPADISKENIGPNISSVGPQSTTAELAGQVPKEPTQKDDSTLGGKVAAGAAAVGVGAAGAAFAANELLKERTGVDAKSKLPESVQKTIDDNAQYSTAAVGQTAPAVPEEVTESQKQALAAPEASSNPEAVQEKSAVEKQLLSEVKTTDATGEPAPTPAAATMAATGVPAEVVGSQREALAAPEASANPEAVQEKSAVETQLLTEVKTTDAKGAPAPTPSAATATTVPQRTDMSNTPVAATAAITNIPAAAAASVPSDATTATTATTTNPPPGPSPPQLSVTGAPQIGHPTGGGLAPIDMNDKEALNATKDSPAEPRVNQIAAEPQPADSRDVSPMSKPTTTSQTQPTVTTGVGSGKAPAQSSAPSTPQKPQTPASAPGTSDSKKEKRRSFFGRIKDKLKARVSRNERQRQQDQQQQRDPGDAVARHGDENARPLPSSSSVSPWPVQGSSLLPLSDNNSNSQANPFDSFSPPSSSGPEPFSLLLPTPPRDSGSKKSSSSPHRKSGSKSSSPARNQSASSSTTNNQTSNNNKNNDSHPPTTTKSKSKPKSKFPVITKTSPSPPSRPRSPRSDLWRAAREFAAAQLEREHESLLKPDVYSEEKEKKKCEPAETKKCKAEEVYKCELGRTKECGGEETKKDKCLPPLPPLPPRRSSSSLEMEGVAGLTGVAGEGEEGDESAP